MNKPAGVALWGAAFILCLGLPAEAASKKYCFFELQSMCPGRQPPKGSKIRKPAKKAPATEVATPPIPAPKPGTSDDQVAIPKPKTKPAKADEDAAATQPKPADKSTAESVPQPQPKPEVADAPDPAPQPEPKPEASEAPQPAPSVPQPEPKPGTVPELPSLDTKPTVDAPAQPDKPQDQAGADQAAACRVDLGKLGVSFMPAQDKDFAPCSIDNAVQLDTIKADGQTVSLIGKPIFNCNFALKFSTWVADVAIPVVQAQEDKALSGLSTGPGFECRNRNGDSEGKISEHASGNAVDIDQIVLADKSRIAISQVSNTNDPHYRMLMALRTSGCGYFTTVLGPGSNAAHASHYHFDLGAHGKSGNYRICE
jgi:hypothetical protein